MLYCTSAGRTVIWDYRTSTCVRYVSYSLRVNTSVSRENRFDNVPLYPHFTRPLRILKCSFLDVGRYRDRIAQRYYNTRVRSLLLEFILKICLTFEILFLLWRPFTDCKTRSRKYSVSEILGDFLTAEKHSWSDWPRLAPQLNRFRNRVIIPIILYRIYIVTFFSRLANARLHDNYFCF